MMREPVRLVVLGTGTAIVTHYYNTCFLLDSVAEYFLVDAGGGKEILDQFQKLNLDFRKLHHAFLSHEHTDHLLGMVWVLRYIAHLMRLEMYEGEFYLYCHDVVYVKLSTICQMLLQPAEYELFGRRIHLVTVEDKEERDILQYHITFFDIHSTKAKQFGFKMAYSQSKTLVFLGDEPLSPTCSKHLKGADWMLSEAFCLYSERDRHHPYRYHHATVKEAAENAQAAGVKNLVLWHTEDETPVDKRQELYTREAEQFYNGRIYVPEDGQSIYLNT
ncbi:MBL fold metallo-hydrolase [Muricomes intestini]|uniref:MBL fold metallo-hydrolase n=1 Tax=Muricomes intestini TaxID=1796634 RepID=UPI002FE4136D